MNDYYKENSADKTEPHPRALEDYQLLLRHCGVCRNPCPIISWL